MHRYALCATNLISQIPISRGQRWVTMVVDSQARAKPTQPTKVRYRSKSERRIQVRLRKQDRKKQSQYRQLVGNFFKRLLKKKGTHLHVWQRRSDEDRCIQAVDIIAHLFHERRIIDEAKDRMWEKIPIAERNRELLNKYKPWGRLRKRSVSCMLAG